MPKTRRNLLAVFSVLILLSLVSWFLFVAKGVFKEPLPTASQTTATEGTTTSSETTTETSGTESEKKKGARIKVFETTDIHGYLVDTAGGKEEAFQYRLAYLANIFEKTRKSGEYDDVLLIDGGDVYQGGPVSNITDGAVMRAAMDIMGYDATVLGNHDFDWGVEEYGADKNATIPAYKFGDYSGDPTVPVLASNLYYANSKERVSFAKDYVIVTKAGYRICLIGYIPDFSDDIMYKRIAPYEIKGDLEAFNLRVKEIVEAEKPDATVVLAHDYCVDVAAAMDSEYVDLVAGGHTHMAKYGVSGTGVAYIQGKNYAHGYANATLVFDENGKVTVEEKAYVSIIEDTSKLLDKPENAGNFDERILKLSHAAWDAIKGEMSENLGYIDQPFGRNEIIKGKTTSGGNFITGLMLEYYKKEGAVAAFFNKGGVRQDFKVPEGGKTDISVSDIYALSPFNNVWLLYDISGEDLAKQIASSLKESDYGDQVSGLTYVYRVKGTKENPEYEIVSITLSNGSKVDIHSKSPVYRIVITNYNATQPGSLFENRKPVYPEADAPVDNQALIEILRDRRDRGLTHIPVDRTPRGYEENEAGQKAA